MNTTYTKEHWGGKDFDIPTNVGELEEAIDIICQRLNQIHYLAETLLEKLLGTDISHQEVEVLSEIAYLTCDFAREIDIEKCIESEKAEAQKTINGLNRVIAELMTEKVAGELLQLKVESYDENKDSKDNPVST